MLSFVSFLDSLLYIFIAILVLLFMITVHEFGHYISGKLLKFKINEFAIGFGPAIFKKKNKKTNEVFSLRCIPLGGYCAFEGEDQENNENPQAFNKQKPWKRLIVLFSGAFMNFIVSVLVIMLVFVFSGCEFVKVVDVYQIAEGTTIESQNGVSNDLLSGDIIYKLDGEYTYIVSTYEILKDKDVGDPISATIYRDGEYFETTLYKAKFVSPETEVNGEIVEAEEYVGLGFSSSMEKIHFSFFKAIGMGFVYAMDMVWYILQVFWQLITGQLSLLSLGGPVTTVSMTAEVARTGFRNLAYMTGMIGINLAVFNLFPIPALDGARMVFVGIEMIRKKPISRKVEGYIHLVGLFALFGFVILIDVIRLFI